MGIVKLNEHYVKLIKHLLRIGVYNHQGIENLLGGMVNRRHICHIANNKRWSHIECPSTIEGQYLWYKFQVEGKL